MKTQDSPCPACPDANRILLVATTPPGEMSCGGAYLRTLCEILPRERIVCHVITWPHRFKKAADMMWLPVVFAGIPELPPRWPKYFAWMTKWKHHAYLKAWRRFRKKEVRNLAVGIAETARRFDVTTILAVLNHPLLFAAVGEAARRADCRLICNVLDQPEYLVRNLGLRPWMRRALLRDAQQTLASAKGIGAASPHTSLVYGQRYGVRSEWVPHSIPRAQQQQSRERPFQSDRLSIGFCGSLYAREEWSVFLDCMIRSGWTIGGRKVSLTLFTKRLPKGVTADMPVYHRGWTTQQESVQALAGLYVAYLPYWFNERYREEVLFAFPSKLTTYLAAGLPLLHHGPAESSISQFMLRYPVGMSCHALDVDLLAETIKRLLAPGFLTSASRACVSTFEMVFESNGT